MADESDKIEDSRTAAHVQVIAKNLDCRDKIGWLERAFVLSYYFLLRW